MPSPMLPQSIVKNKATRINVLSSLSLGQVIAVQHVYDCTAGFSNWRLAGQLVLAAWDPGILAGHPRRKFGVVSTSNVDAQARCGFFWAKMMAGSHTGHLSKTVVTGVSTHEGPTYYHHAESYGDESYGDTATWR